MSRPNPLTRELNTPQHAKTPAWGLRDHPRPGVMVGVPRACHLLSRNLSPLLSHRDSGQGAPYPQVPGPGGVWFGLWMLGITGVCWMTESAMTAMESRLSADIAGLDQRVAGLEQRMDQGFRQIADRVDQRMDQGFRQIVDYLDRRL